MKQGRMYTGECSLFCFAMINTSATLDLTTKMNIMQNGMKRNLLYSFNKVNPIKTT